jgi:hypothetical protein
MVELALVLPLFVMVLMGTIVLGIGVFYQQQLANAAREGARYAAIHTATAQCPSVSHEDPAAPPQTYYRCDPPELGWPEMTAAARTYLFGLSPSAVRLAACWAGYTDPGIDAPPTNLTTGGPNPFSPCTIGGIDPQENADLIACPPPPTTPADDTASSMSASNGLMANEVTVFTCFVWQPPLAGFLLIPETVTLRSVVTEKLEYQQ